MAVNMTVNPDIRIQACGDCALTVSFAEQIDRHINALVIAFTERLADARISGIVELVPTFRSLMVHYDPDKTSHAALKTPILALLDGLTPTTQKCRIWRLPACFDSSVAPDLEDVSTRTGVSRNDVIALCTDTVFHIYMIGFLPGYPYMGDLPKALSLPRRQDPRITVPRGSIAIAERMAAVYPLESPGGWHLVGRTPVALYDPDRDSPGLLSAGDKVQFVEISLADYDRMSADAEAGTLNISPEPLEESGQ